MSLRLSSLPSKHKMLTLDSELPLLLTGRFLYDLTLYNEVAGTFVTDGRKFPAMLPRLISYKHIYRVTITKVHKDLIEKCSKVESRLKDAWLMSFNLNFFCYRTMCLKAMSMELLDRFLPNPKPSGPELDFPADPPPPPPSPRPPLSVSRGGASFLLFTFLSTF